jgi:hypothetical protein
MSSSESDSKNSSWESLTNEKDEVIIFVFHEFLLYIYLLVTSYKSIKHIAFFCHMQYSLTKMIICVYFTHDKVCKVHVNERGEKIYRFCLWRERARYGTNVPCFRLGPI